MEKYKLKDCCKFIDYRGKTPEKSDAGYRLITVKNVKPSGYCDEPKEYIPIESYESVMVRGIPKAGDILFTTEAPLGNIGRIPEFTEPFAVGQRIIVIQPKVELLDYQYMVYKLRSPSFQEEMFRRSSGSTVKGIRSKELVEIEIDFPELKEQKRISKILFALERIIEARKNELEQLDDLIKARFVELFGDPICNSKNMILSPLNDVCTRITDGTHDTPPRYDSGYLLITGKNIRSSGIIFDDVEFVSEEDHKIIYSRCNPEYGDVLYTNIGVNYGTACYNNLEYEFSMKNVALLKPNHRLVNGYYLWECLNIMRNHILSMNQVGGAQTFMGLAAIKKIIIPVPQIELQKQFAEFVTQVDKSKVAVQKALDEAQLLFDSLMQKYFG